MQYLVRLRYLAVLLPAWSLQLLKALVDNPLRDAYEAMWATASMPLGRLLLVLIVLDSLRQIHRLLADSQTGYRQRSAAWFSWLRDLTFRLPLAGRDLLLWLLGGCIAIESAVLSGAGSEAEVLAEVAGLDPAQWPLPLRLAGLCAAAWAVWVLLSNQIASDALRPLPLESDAVVVHAGWPIPFWQRPFVIRRLRRLAESSRELLVVWRMPSADPAQMLSAAEAWLAPVVDRHFATKLLDRLLDLRLHPPRRAGISLSFVAE